MVGAAFLAPQAATLAAEKPDQVIDLGLGKHYPGQKIKIKIKDRRVSEKVEWRGPDGQVQLIIPEGFPRANIPADMSRYDFTEGPQPPKESVVALGCCDAYAQSRAHWTQVYQAGVDQPGNQRAFFLLDRTNNANATSDWLRDFSSNTGIRNGMIARGLSGEQSPYTAYWGQPYYEGGCQKYGWAIPNDSFVTVCWTNDTGWACDNANVNGCSWTVDECCRHNGKEFQPSTFIKAFVLSRPWGLRNMVYHEMLHTYGMNHNLSNTCSIMWWNIDDCGGAVWNYKSLTNSDFDELVRIYNHPTPD